MTAWGGAVRRDRAAPARCLRHDRFDTASAPVINPKTILGEWVTVLQSCPDLAAALGGNGDNIRAFMEGLATDNNLRLAILQMPTGSILVAWNGTTARRLTGGALHFAHRFSIYLRAPEQSSTATYADLFWLSVSAIPTAPSWASLLHFQIDPDCYPMDMDLPSAHRNTVVVSADGTTLDYFAKFKQRSWRKATPEGNEENVLDWVFMQSPEGEVREVEATAAALTPLTVAGWHQVPAPVATNQKPPTATEEEK